MSLARRLPKLKARRSAAMRASYHAICANGAIAPGDVCRSTLRASTSAPRMALQRFVGSAVWCERGHVICANGAIAPGDVCRSTLRASTSAPRMALQRFVGSAVWCERGHVICANGAIAPGDVCRSTLRASTSAPRMALRRSAGPAVCCGRDHGIRANHMVTSRRIRRRVRRGGCRPADGLAAPWDHWPVRESCQCLRECHGKLVDHPSMFVVRPLSSKARPVVALALGVWVAYHAICANGMIALRAHPRRGSRCPASAQWVGLRRRAEDGVERVGMSSTLLSTARNAASICFRTTSWGLARR